MVETTQMLCMDINFWLTVLDKNYAPMGTALGEKVIAMRKKLTYVTGYVSDLYQSLSTILIQLRTLIKQVDNMEERSMCVTPSGLCSMSQGCPHDLD